MATLGEIDETVRAFRDAGGTQLTLLKCTSAYPAPPEEMNLRTIPHLAQAFQTPADSPITRWASPCPSPRSRSGPA